MTQEREKSAEEKGAELQAAMDAVNATDRADDDDVAIAADDQGATAMAQKLQEQMRGEG